MFATVQLHGPELPEARCRRQGAGYGLIPLLLFIVLSTAMLVGPLLQERSPAKRCCVETVGPAALITDIGSFGCSVMDLCLHSVYVGSAEELLSPLAIYVQKRAIADYSGI